MDFKPSDGKYLAYPSNREIIILSSENWSQRMTFTHSTVSIFFYIFFYKINLFFVPIVCAYGNSTLMPVFLVSAGCFFVVVVINVHVINM